MEGALALGLDLCERLDLVDAALAEEGRRILLVLRDDLGEQAGVAGLDALIAVGGLAAGARGLDHPVGVEITRFGVGEVCAEHTSILEWGLSARRGSRCAGGTRPVRRAVPARRSRPRS